MSIIKMLDEFSSENLMNKKSSRRDMFGTLSSFGKKAAMAAVPFGLATNKAKAAAFQDSGNSAVDALQLALTLEYLEAQFYIMALDATETEAMPFGILRLIRFFFAITFVLILYVPSSYLRQFYVGLFLNVHLF